MSIQEIQDMFNVPGSLKRGVGMPGVVQDFKDQLVFPCDPLKLGGKMDGLFHGNE